MTFNTLHGLHAKRVDDKEGKPLGIQKFIGRRPIFAFGNSDGDLRMLQWTAAGSGLRFMGQTCVRKRRREVDST